MITKLAVEAGTISLNDIIGLMTHNYSRAAARGLTLSWKYKNGLYNCFAKKNTIVVFEQVYSEDMLIKAIIYMQIDFWEFLNLKATY